MQPDEAGGGLLELRGHVDEELGGVGLCRDRLGRLHLVGHGVLVVVVLPVLVDDPGEFPEHLDVVRLSAHQRAHGREAIFRDRAPAQVLEVVEERGCGALALPRHDAGKGGELGIAHGFEDPRGDGLALAEDDAVDDLGVVGEVVEREADRLRLEVREPAPVVVVAEDLEIKQPDIVSSRAHRSRHALETQRLETQLELRVHERAGMDEGEPHEGESTAATRRCRPPAWILASAPPRVG